MSKTVFVLGASDPEMQAIEALLNKENQIVVYAMKDGKRVFPAVAYRGSAEIPEGTTKVVLVECEVPVPKGVEQVIVDHHNPGDPGFGKLPVDYWQASSIGQVMKIVNPSHYSNPHVDFRFVAAADHCLGAAYRNQCPGVSADDLMEFRAKQRSEFQKIPVERILESIKNAQDELNKSHIINLNINNYKNQNSTEIMVMDCRREYPIAELPEAATRLGLSYISGPLFSPDGRKKFTCSGEAHHIKAFMEDWGPNNDLVDMYGDPARGFAGGYLKDVI